MSAKGNSRRLRRLSLLAAVGASAALAIVGSSALGASVTGAAFSGGPGTAIVGGKLYARQGQRVTLTVTTSPDTKCVSISGVQTDVQTSASPKSTWTFPALTAPAGNGLQTVNIVIGEDFNKSNVCTKQTNTGTAVYELDNMGPTVTGAVSPAPNAAGWNRGDVALTWSATDAGSGVAGAAAPATDSVTSNTAGATKTATATDRLGNQGSGSVTVKLDKTAPTIDGTRSPAANANGWNNGDVTVSLTCADALSGIKSCTGGGTKVLSTEGANQSVTATAVDNADNSATTSVSPLNVDKTPPTLTGAVAGGALGDNGWYRGNVTIHWTAADALSGIATAPADSTVAGEGQALKATASVSDRAGNQTVADSPTVKIDKTAPNTDASAVDAWNNVDVIVSLTPNDAMSGVAATHYRVDGGSTQDGTQVSLSDEGVHSLEYWSVDKAGNVEDGKDVSVRIDKTSPTITHTFAPGANANGWFKDAVSVTFSCADSLSGIKSCGPDRVVSDEGADQNASGEAIDNAGNKASDPAQVSIDRTLPTIKASVDRPANANGWYDGAVTVSFACGDALSGVDTCPAAKTLGEGKDQSASATVADAAGNTATDGVSGIDVDKTSPALSGEATTAPNGNGWYRGDVTVAWTASDELSGLDGDTPADSTVDGEGSNLSAIATVNDKAGNTTTRTVDGIKIDRMAPTTTSDVAEPLESGWYAAAVKVTLNGLDSLSHVDRTYYSVDGGAAQDYSSPFDFGEKGVHAITFWSVDKAGNVEGHSDAGHSITLKIDGIPPTIVGNPTPTANGFGWNNTPVTVTFDCNDDESGIGGCSDPVTLSGEGAAQSAHGEAVDNAGNHGGADLNDINIDLTAPTLTAAPTTDANAAGWYRGDVTIHWTGQDGLSGIDPATSPADSTIGGEGDNLGAGPVTVSDKAGNVSDASSVSAIRIDRTAPMITGAPKSQPNNDGWYGGAVVVGFSCTDNLSGVAGCPSDKLVSGNGAGQSVSSDPATDNAGNNSAGKTVGGLNIDGLPPQTVAANQCTKTNGWCTGSSATVVLTATDQPALSGVKEIHYRVNGGAEQVAAGATKSVNVALDGSGEAGVTFYAVDKAGNQEPQNGVSLQYDNIAPIVTHTLAPSPNADQWNRSDVTVHFDAKDNDGGSGVDPGKTTPDVTVAGETAGLTVNGEAFDVAGNRGTDSVLVKLDKTAPTISGAVVSGQLGAGGWYVGPVKVHFTCSDDGSNVAVCPDDVTLTSNGAGQSVTREAVDFAGNKATAKVSGIDIDQEKPAITLSGIKNGGIYTLGAVPVPSCSAQDGFSGAGACSVTTAGGKANGVGDFAYTATATDKAGNTTTLTGTYRVIYRFDGFLQPINDTAHQVDTTTSIFKAGSTVPVKLQLKRADGSTVQATTAPIWEVPAKGSPMTAPVSEAAYSVVADGAATYRWDGTNQQYMYNWGTDPAGKGYYHRIGVKLDDGQTYFVNIGLR
ncbi:OmpL47-type beta-barrel domain-containing protein [Candidatus Solirubrobacter pratensis]|uniref:OmpL47-type beta-barrel domain-containing protein n=1 Tax=Candidatus Solirubrobacter pratensis TaxID=1298857 RepID=UPI0012DC841C|nr:PxKF domain-containing protein [Candidatus Solirubrobacter pratensis]